MSQKIKKLKIVVLQIDFVFFKQNIVFIFILGSYDTGMYIGGFVRFTHPNKYLFSLFH